MNKLKIFSIVFLSVIMFACGQSTDGEKSKENKEALVQKPVMKKDFGTFDYVPVTPNNGTLAGVVELGASGFNSFIVELDKLGNYVVKDKQFGNSLVTEGMTDGKEVNKKLRQYIKSIIDFGVKGKDIHFVVSSGAAKASITRLIIKELKNIGYVVNEVTPEKEAQYAFKAAMPFGYREKAFVVDIGSGNTKISYLKNDKIIGHELVGAKYFKKNITDAVAFNEAKDVASKIPASLTQYCFIIGGVPYNMAKPLRQGKERYTVLSTNIASYDKLVAKKGDKIRCGLNIYKGIMESTKCNTYVFDWDANFTIGFLLSHYGKK